MCCSYHIGRAYKNKLADCNFKCEAVITDGDKKKDDKKNLAKASASEPKASAEKSKKASRKENKPKKKTSSKAKVTQKMKNFFKD
jgi:hypothetical protein